MGFPCGSAGKESACNVGNLGSIPGLGRSPGEGKGYPLQYSGLENSRLLLFPSSLCSWSNRFHLFWGFPGGSDGKASACNEGHQSSIPGSGRCPGEGKGSPLQHSCLENTMDGGYLIGYSPWGRKESDTTDWATSLFTIPLTGTRKSHFKQVSRTPFLAFYF